MLLYIPLAFLSNDEWVGLPTTDTMEIVLPQVQHQFELIWGDSNSIDQKAVTLISAATVILMLAAILQVNLLLERTNTYWLMVAIGVGASIASIVTALWAVRPRQYGYAFSFKPNILYKDLLLSPKPEALYQMIESYLIQTAVNAKLNHDKSRLLIWSGILLMIAVIFFIVSAAVLTQGV